MSGVRSSIPGSNGEWWAIEPYTIFVCYPYVHISTPVACKCDLGTKKQHCKLQRAGYMNLQLENLLIRKAIVNTFQAKYMCVSSNWFSLCIHTSYEYVIEIYSSYNQKCYFCLPGPLVRHLGPLRLSFQQHLMLQVWLVVALWKVIPWPGLTRVCLFHFKSLVFVEFGWVVFASPKFPKWKTSDLIQQFPLVVFFLQVWFLRNPKWMGEWTAKPNQLVMLKF